MEYLKSKRFSFTVASLPADTFNVVSFKGTERISEPYQFEIMVLSDNLEIDFEAVINNRASLTLHREEGGDVLYQGIVADFEQLHDMDGYAFYRARLVPKFWWLAVIQNNQVFLGETVPEFVEAILKDGGLFSGIDYEFRLQGAYEPVEYVCQYGETHLNFLSRWCERDGIYYYFEQTEQGEKVIFTDTKIAHVDSPLGAALVYSPPSGLEALRSDEAVQSFRCRKSVLPAKVLLKDYNYRRPSLDVAGTAEVSTTGRGTVYFYNEHFRTAEDGTRLAGIRAESIICRGEEYLGESSVPSMISGYTFSLTEHYRVGFNRKYLTIEVEHEGDQSSLLPVGAGSGPRENRSLYRNRFTAIPKEVQFRSRVVTKKPKVSGAIPATIDGAGSGQYAELDDMGRYKVIIPFDLSGRVEGKASSWIRMAQPYGGSGHGMHFPLHKGTEVLLTFVSGDPDRPIIAAAVPNPSTPSLVTSANQTANVIHSAGGNKIHMEDQEGSQHLLLQTPTAGSSIRMGDLKKGATGDDNTTTDTDKEKKGPLGIVWETKVPVEGEGATGISLATSQTLDITAQYKNEIILGDVNETVVGGIADLCIGGRAIVSVGLYSDVTGGAKQEIVPKKAVFTGFHREVTMEKHEAHELDEKFTDRDNSITNLSKLIANESTTIANTETKLVNDMRQMEERLTQLINDRIAVVNEDIATTNGSVRAQKTRVDAVETSVGTVQNDVRAVENRVEEASARVDGAETAIVMTQNYILQGAAVLEDAPLIVQG